jgi:putative hydroxymethylpyrimidine transport system substrate-binding protein
MRRFWLLLAGVAVLLLPAGCGGGGETAEQQNWTFETPRLNLDGEPGAENVGPVLAGKLDYFGDVKLGTFIEIPLSPERPTRYVDHELVDAAIAQEPQVVLAQEAGRPLVIFGSLLSTATMAMIWLPDSGIESIADLEGKTIAYPGVAFQKDFLQYVLEGAGLTLADVTLEDVGYEMASSLASGRADAIFGGSGNEEGALLEARGLDPVVTRATDLGIPEYDELVLIARRDRYAKDPELFQRILDASIRGNEAAGEDAETAARAIVDQGFTEAQPKSAQAGVEATAPLLSTSGEVDEGKLEELVDWMHEQGMIKREIPPSELIAPGGE